jgi:hypothetical protein
MSTGGSGIFVAGGETMGFLSGRVSFVRYRIGGDRPLPFQVSHLEQLEQHAIGRHGAGESQDGVTVGWSAGEHVLDTSFGLEKNVLEDALHMAIRIDTDKIPGELLRAYTQIELDARMVENPNGRPTKSQRDEAKEAALARALLEAADGRFRRRKHYPVLWDGLANVLYVGATSTAVLDRLVALFRDTFDRALEPISTGRLAAEHAAERQNLRLFEELSPTDFLENTESLQALAWSPDPASPDYLGNEMLVWLWHVLQSAGDTIALSDASEVSVMLAKTLLLDCPRGETGRDSLSDTGPARMPEAIKALQAGKLPRKAGLVLVRHDQQYELTLQAETLAVSGLALPKVDGATGRDLRLARIESLRHAVDTLDLLLTAFLDRRTGQDWSNDLDRIRRWLDAA